MKLRICCGTLSRAITGCAGLHPPNSGREESGRDRPLENLIERRVIYGRAGKAGYSARGIPTGKGTGPGKEAARSLMAPGKHGMVKSKLISDTPKINLGGMELGGAVMA